MQNPPQTLQLSWEKVQLYCLKRGKSLLELARETGLSRTTLNNWASGRTIKPHGQKITAIAEALNVPVEELLVNPPKSEAGIPKPVSLNSNLNSIDQRFNPQIQDVAEQKPELFRNWTNKDWEELYSEFGVGGGLTPQGVKSSVDYINRKKEILKKLELILESDMADVAEATINAFFQKVNANPQKL